MSSKHQGTGGKWIPPLPKGTESVAYGLDGEQITESAWDYDLTEGIAFEPLPPAQMSDSLKALQESLPGSARPRG